MKFIAASIALTFISSVASAPVESDVLTKAKALYKRNSPILEYSGLQKRHNGKGSSGGSSSGSSSSAPTDADILNFALQLEYLEAEFYHYAVYGTGLDGSLLTGKGKQGGVSGGKQVPFKSQIVKQYATEIATDEMKHVKDLRAALGGNAVAQPAINIGTAFSAAATAAGIIKKGETFDPYMSDDNFLLGAFLFEDVGVTAYNGAAPLISSKAYLAAAAGILAVEAYHASEIRTNLFIAGQMTPSIITIANKAAAVEGAVDSGKSQGIKVDGVANIVPTDGNSIAFARTPGEVLDIVYLTASKGATKGGFFPNGLNGNLKTAAGAGN